MNKALKEAIFKQKVRASIKTKLLKNMLAEETSLYAAFVQPFTDVLDAVNLGAQEILNSTFTFFSLLLTWDPEKAREKLRKHDERKAKIAEKWKPLMERTDAALSTGDADILALTFAPGVYALSDLGGKAYNATEGMGSFLNNVGLKVPFLGAIIPGYDASGELDSKEDKVGSLLDKLEMLFLGAVAVGSLTDPPKGALRQSETNRPKGRILSEGVDQELLNDFNQFLEDTGVMAELKKSRDELIDGLKEDVKLFDDEYEARAKVFEGIKESTSLEEFEKAIDDIETATKETEAGISSQKIKQELRKGAQELAQNKEFKEKSSENAKKELTDDELLDFALKVVFEDAKKGLVGQMEEALDVFRKETGKALEEMLPSDTSLEVIKKTKDGIKFADFVEKTKRKYEIG